MSRPSIRIHNIETDEVIDREMNDAEYAVYQQEQQVLIERENEMAQKAAAKEALLERLGITAEEATLLLTGNQ